MRKEWFNKEARALVGQHVEVVTTNGTYTGTLLSVGSNFIIMRTRIRGQLVRLLIRIALIIALFRLIGGGTGGGLFGRPSSRTDLNMQNSFDYDQEL